MDITTKKKKKKKHHHKKYAKKDTARLRFGVVFGGSLPRHQRWEGGRQTCTNPKKSDAAAYCCAAYG
jgi:hypothetical protein